MDGINNYVDERASSKMVPFVSSSHQYMAQQSHTNDSNVLGNEPSTMAFSKKTTGDVDISLTEKCLEKYLNPKFNVRPIFVTFETFGDNKTNKGITSTIIQNINQSKSYYIRLTNYYLQCFSIFISILSLFYIIYIYLD
jgi:hypothetical protein|tara:strand:+ start:50 stop:466 length:417 start_codon:yes stop_codon:yes gene_type:complete